MKHTTWKDSRGWCYRVMPGLQDNPPMYKGRYSKKGDSPTGWHGIRSLAYRASLDEAEADLAEYARVHKFEPVAVEQIEGCV